MALYVSTHHPNTLILRRPPSKKKVVDSTFSVIMSVMLGMSSATDLSLLRDARDAPKWPRCKLCASEGKHLPKKDGSESQGRVTILHGLVGRDLREPRVRIPFAVFP